MGTVVVDRWLVPCETDARAYVYVLICMYKCYVGLIGWMEVNDSKALGDLVSAGATSELCE